MIRVRQGQGQSRFDPFILNAFMMKPIDLPQLLQTIRQVLAGDKNK
jgi:hypothetical protein